eukprot:jgi/Mesvir1/8828/Mv02729-RA.1
MASERTLDEVMAVPGLGAQLMGLLRIPDRVRLRRTCRSFLSAVDASFLTLTDIFGEDTAPEGARPTTAGLAWLITKCPALTVLSVASRAVHEAPWQERESVRTTLEGTWVGSDWPLSRTGLTLEGIAANCKGLTYLNLADCKGVTDAGIVALARSCRGLQALDISKSQVGDEGVVAVARSCRGLRRLAVSYCKHVSDDSAAQLGSRCKRLEQLFLDFTVVTDESIIAVAGGCPHLRRLTVSEHVTDDGMSAVARHCGRLEHLGVWGCMGVTNDSIMRIAENCQGLTRLDAAYSDVGDEGLLVLAQMCGGLRRLDLSNTSITDEGLVDAVQAGLGRLEYLDVEACSGVSDDGIEEVVRKCAALRHLSVAECTGVTDEGIRAVAEHVRGIEGLVIRETRVTDEGVRAIAAKCHELRYLDMGGCDGVGGKALAAVAKGCPKLESLDLRATRCVTKASVAAISHYCKGLRAFGALETPLTDDHAAKLIKERGSQLWELALNLTYVTDKTIDLVGQLCPRLRKLSR